MYYCKTPDPSNTKLCLEWVQINPFWVELSQLTYYDTNVIIGYTASIFATAWLWKRLSLHASRN